MRPNVEGTVARGELRTDDHLERGRVIKDGAEVWADTVPSGLEVTEDFVRRGQERFNIYCAPCHGWSGLGDGPIHRRAQSLVDGSPTLSYGTVWVQPKNLHEQIYLDQSIGQIYATITLGHDPWRAKAANPGRRPLGHRGLCEGLAGQRDCRRNHD